MDKPYIQLLENQYCFPLYTTSRLVIKLYTPFLKTLGITYSQYLVMLVLWQNNNRSVKELGKVLFLESNTLTPLLKRLEHKNLVIRTRNNEDERVVVVTLTEEGEMMKNRAKNLPENIADKLSKIGVSSTELNQLKSILDKFTKGLSK